MAGARARTVYVCSACGAESPKWAGRCPECGAWNTLGETTVQAAGPPRAGARAGFAGAAGRGGPVRLAEVRGAEAGRLATGIEELDRVLGGGLVPGSVVLLGGDPGVGKSTLLLQATAAVADRVGALYVTGEESPEQVALRAARLGLEGAPLALLAETAVERIVAEAERARPAVMVVDSVQTLWTEALQSAPGSVAQVRESAAQLTRFAKASGTTVLLVGHVTKEGTLAGPRVLEHMVDTVLYFEGEPGGRLRMVRAVKNRYGAVNELGVFAMTDRGLRAVGNPSAIFLSRHGEAVPGSVVMAALEGTRPLLVEVQALVDQSPLANPRRLAQGLDGARLAMLLAVLHRHGGVGLLDQDVYVNVVGGVRVAETAADLPVVLAALSSFRGRALPRELVVFGEVGLAGEVRPVPGGEQRLREAARQGFRHAIVPRGNVPKGGVEGLALHVVTRLQEALEAAAALA
ncbi:MAG TPA: DNA repair protein RadA [Chromatiales bacterium]|nr:DNA repair protein RadA [Chromatiales bacterium]